MNRKDFERVKKTLKQAIGQSLDSAALTDITDALQEGQLSSSCTFSYVIGNNVGGDSQIGYLSPVMDILVICDAQRIIRQLLCFDRNARPQDFEMIGDPRPISNFNDRITL